MTIIALIDCDISASVRDVLCVLCNTAISMFLLFEEKKKWEKKCVAIFRKCHTSSKSFKSIWNINYKQYFVCYWIFLEMSQNLCTTHIQTVVIDEMSFSFCKVTSTLFIIAVNCIIMIIVDFIKFTIYQHVWKVSNGSANNSHRVKSVNNNWYWFKQPLQ